MTAMASESPHAAWVRASTNAAKGWDDAQGRAWEWWPHPDKHESRQRYLAERHAEYKHLVLSWWGKLGPGFLAEGGVVPNEVARLLAQEADFVQELVRLGEGE